MYECTQQTQRMSVTPPFLSRIYADSLKVPKLLFRFLLRAANSLATSIRESLSVLGLWLLSIVRLLNLVRVIVERSHVFSLRAEEKDLSPHKNKELLWLFSTTNTWCRKTFICSSNATRDL